MIAIKICGITTPQDALAAIDAGATHLGINFYAGSPRAVDFYQAQAISRAARLRQPSPVLVGVFVNEDPSVIAAALEFVYLDLAQLSGDETPDEFNALNGLAFKVYHLQPGQPPNLTMLRTGAPQLLIDARVPGQYGGTGQTADWTTAAQLAQQQRLFLAGGLQPSNVAEAVRQVRPWGVDVASGVESAPGQKDPAKMAAFVDEVRRAEAELN